MSTRCNVLVVEKNGDWEHTSQFYRHCDGYVEETGKDLAILAYMAKEYSYPDVSNYDNFKRIRNRFLGYLNDSDNYEAEEFDDSVHGDIEFLYLVRIERVVNGSVQIAVEYIVTPIGSDRNEYVQKILNGEGTEIELEVK
jgi:hypothetical protein